jgi:hypothetical protein
MIIAIKAVVNHQMIIDSIQSVTLETKDTEEKTNYINNFLTPYLESEFAPYFFAHENNQIFPWEKIIKIITINKSNTTTSQITWSLLSHISWWTSNIWQRNLYIKQLIEHITIWHNNILFFK